MQYVVEQTPHSNELNERLRMETGWDDVASGLGRILFGYVVFLLGVAVGVTLVLVSAYGWLFGDGARPNRLPSISVMWQFYIGLGILSVIGVFGYLIIMGGQWKCLHGASERHGARWLMFFCLTALLAGPALNGASFYGGVQRYPELRRGLRGLSQIQFTVAGRHMQFASAAATGLYSLLFLLFLRAVARCHDSSRHLVLVNVGIVLVILLLGGTVYTGYLAFKGDLPDDTPILQDPRVWVAGGWLVLFIYYLFLIGSLRNCVKESLARVRSPLDY
jgi:hypothetical protein